MFKVGVEDPAGESLPADPDSLQDAVAAELVNDQVIVHDTWREVKVRTHRWSCCWTGRGHVVPGVLDSLGIRQRTKWGWVLLRLVISFPRFSCRTSGVDSTELKF